MDPAKLKVVELRAELASRGLDTKGNKPVLVKRLREALEAESGNELPDTSIADTSTEDFNTSTASVTQPSPERVVTQPEPEPPSEPVKEPPAESPPKSRSRRSADVPEPQPEPEPVVEKMEESVPEVQKRDPTPEPEPEPEKPQEVEKETPEEQEPEPEESMETESAEPQNDGDKQMEDDAPQEEPAEEAAVEEQESVSVEKVPEVQKRDPTPEPEPEPEKPQEVEKETPEEQEPEPEESMETESAEPQNDGDKQMEDDAPQEEPAEEAAVEEQESVSVEKDAEPRRKSRWGSESADASTADDSTAGGSPRGEKRRHGSSSPDRLQRKRSRSPIREDEPEAVPEDVHLSWIDSDLNLQVNKENFLVAEPMHTEGFGLMWAGVRASHGVNNGKVCFEVKLLEDLEWEDSQKDRKDKNKDKKKKEEEGDKPEGEKPQEEESEEKPEEKPEEKEEPTEPVHIFRVGWSLPSTDLQLGEQPHSYGYDSEGLSVTNSEFTEFGIQYSAGDVVGTFLELSPDTVTITYTVNGALLPAAFTTERSELPEDSVLFPHLLTRNIKFEVNFGQKEEPWFQPPDEFSDYTFVQNVEDKIAGLSRPAERKECEVLMTVGLPCSGKTHWANTYVAENPEKKYCVLGLSNVLDKMKYRNQSRKVLYKSSSTLLMENCTRCLNKLIDVASTRRRNYILDQTNLFSSAQRRKLRPFDGFRRQAVVIVVADDEQSSREKSRQQADGKDVPDSAVLEMKANMCLPTACDWLDEVKYVELDEEKAKEIVQKYNKQGREAGYGPNYTAKAHNNQKMKFNDKRNVWGRNNRFSERDNGRDNRNNRWGGGGGGGGHNRQNNWGNNRGSGGWGGRHDNRNHHHGGRGGDYRNNSNNRMMVGGSGGGYNRNQGGSGGGGGYNRNKHNRNPQNKGGNWGGQGGGGSWNSQGNWGGQGGWAGGHQSGGQGSGSGWNQGSWSQYGGQGGQGSGGGQGGGQQWKGGYNNSQQYQQQGYPQGYAASQYGQGQYANWNYYGQYAQGWNNAQGQQSNSGSDGSGTTAQYNQYTQQQQAAWAQYAQGGYGGYGQAASQGSTAGNNAVTGAAANQTSATK